MTGAEQRPVVFAVDANYLVPLKVVIYSLLECTAIPGRVLTIIILHGGIEPDEQFSVPAQLAKLEWRRVSLSDGIEFPISDWISSAAYFRLAIGTSLLDYESCLYLDVDTLVLESLDPLLTCACAPQGIAAVQDPQNPTLRAGDALPGWQSLGMSPDRQYFNSGVLLLNLNACRAERLFERAFGFIAEHPANIRYWDQDALNFAANDDWMRLDRAWNTFPLSAILRTPGPHQFDEDVLPLSQLLADEGVAKLLHFTGPVKPWHPQFPEGRAKALYQQAALRARGLFMQSSVEPSASRTSREK